MQTISKLQAMRFNDQGDQVTLYYTMGALVQKGNVIMPVPQFHREIIDHCLKEGGTPAFRHEPPGWSVTIPRSMIHFSIAELCVW